MILMLCRGGDGGRRPSLSSLQPGVEESVKPAGLSNGGAGRGGAGPEEVRGGFVLKCRSDEAPVRRRSLVERTGMKNLMQVRVTCCRRVSADRHLVRLDHQSLEFSSIPRRSNNLTQENVMI